MLSISASEGAFRVVHMMAFCRGSALVSIGFVTGLAAEECGC